MSNRVSLRAAAGVEGRTLDSHTADLLGIAELVETSDWRPELRRSCELFALLGDCEENRWPDEWRGATYRTLGYIAHRVGMNAGQRRQWFAACNDFGLTERHAGHIIARLDDREAEQPAG
jgi:hypothetical protein